MLYSRCPPGQMRALWCFFNPSMVTDFASIEWSEGRLPELLDIRSPSVQSGMARIAREVLAPSPASHAMVEGTLLVLLSDLCRGFSTRQPRSEERRAGNECVRTCSYRWAPDNK